MKLFDPNNGIKVGDIVTAVFPGLWKVTSIEPRFVDDFDITTEPTIYKAIGDAKNSLIHYELFCDETYNLSEPGKRKNRCDAKFCKVVDINTVKNLVEEKLKELDRLVSMASKANITKNAYSILKLSSYQNGFAAEQVGQWLDKSRDDRNKTYADATHSTFLQRLFSGKKALKYPPPCLYSYPCYPLGEGEKVEVRGSGVHEVLNETTGKTLVYVGNSSHFEWHDKQAGILVNPPTKELFKIWDEGDKKFIQKVEVNAVT